MFDLKMIDRKENKEKTIYDNMFSIRLKNIIVLFYIFVKRPIS
jgi:hypothetical protein